MTRKPLEARRLLLPLGFSIYKSTYSFDPLTHFFSIHWKKDSNEKKKMSRHPMVKWAQRSDKVYITIELPDAKDVKLNLEPEGKFYFSATSGADKIPYEVDIELHDNVNVDESKASIGVRNICYLVKKAEKKWWSRLLKQEGKSPVFLKVDWDKWVDEDEEQERKSGDDMDFGGMDFSNLNLGGAGNFDMDDDKDEDDGETTDEAKKAEDPTEGGGSETKA